MNEPMDYSFMHLGGLYQAIVEATIEACRRFGAEKAQSVISAAIYWKHRGETERYVKSWIYDETGLEISDDDVSFLFALSDAREMIEATEKHLKEKCHGR